MRTKGVAAGTALEIVEHLAIKLAAQTGPGDATRRTTDQPTEYCPGDAADGDSYRAAYCANQRAGLGTTPGAGRATGGAGHGTRGATYLPTMMARHDPRRAAAGT
ncbi:hypothetical protein [Modicisalibacter ilicicola]|uniref:hypothetical protein n=1 Tax=Modicisalibacter ilicicola TaxID=480814 RepID=UPI001587ECD2|nr:hypothetical protein [Halomonas ilicicola]